MIYKGEISGNGDAKTRENEITPDNVALFRHWAVGHKYGVVYSPDHDFVATVSSETIDGKYTNTVHVSDGTMFAYGYFGYTPAVNFTFLPPAVEQWHIIYIELDRSVIPNTCIIKTKNNQGSERILSNAFRQDEMSIVKTGVFQLPLWGIRVTNNGIDVLDFKTNQARYDLRKIVHSIKNVEYAGSTDRVTGKIPSGVRCVTSPQGTSDKTVASRAFALKEIQAAINK